MKHCMVDAKSFLVLCKYLTQVEFLWFFSFFFPISGMKLKLKTVAGHQTAEDHLDVFQKSEVQVRQRLNCVVLVLLRFLSSKGNM